MKEDENNPMATYVGERVERLPDRPLLVPEDEAATEPKPIPPEQDS